MVNLFNTEININSRENVRRVLESGFLSEGNVVRDFEKEIQNLFSFQNFAALSSGTAALHLALVLAGVKPGDEVILPAQTFVASGLAILYCGAKPVFADIDEFGNISLESIVSKITKRTKAVMMVHWVGIPCDIKPINEYCQALGIKTIEDAAQAFGANYRFRTIGRSESDFICFSFQATKILTTGDGGGLICKSNLDSIRAKNLRWFGIDRKRDWTDDTGERLYDLEEIGYKYQMNNVSGAIGLGQLKTFPSRLTYNVINANYYKELIGGKFPSYSHQSNFWVYPFMANERNILIKSLVGALFESSVIHQGIDRNKIFGGYDNTLINQRKFEKHFIALPISVNSLQLETIQGIIEKHERQYGKYWE